MAREALSSGDKILSENYFQHADHFTRILNEQEGFKKMRYSENNKDESKTDQANNTGKKEITEDGSKNNTSEIDTKSAATK